MLFSVQYVTAEKNYTNEKVIFLPQDFYVGDLVEMRVVILPEEGVEVRRPERFPESSWMKIEDAMVVDLDGKYEFRIFIRPFSPGIRTLPPVQFGDVLLRDLRIQVKSVLEENPSSFAPPAEQMLLPLTNYYIAVIVGLIILFPLLIIVFGSRVKNKIHSHFNERRRKKPYKRFAKAVKDLGEQMNRKKGREFYTTLIDELRLYLSARGKFNYSTATASEIAQVIESDFPCMRDTPGLSGLFLFADKVKFGSKRVMVKKREEDLLMVMQAVDKIETWFFEGGGKDVDF
jgi:hypothetical protein